MQTQRRNKKTDPTKKTTQHKIKKINWDNQKGNKRKKKGKMAKWKKIDYREKHEYEKPNTKRRKKTKILSNKYKRKWNHQKN